MKNFYQNLILFGLCFMLSYPILIIIWGRFLPPRMTPNIKYEIGAYGFINSRLNEVKKMSDVDILFLGSSHAYRGFDTRIYKDQGLIAFNLGSSAQTPLQTKVLLDRYLEDLNPSIVIYEVNPLAFSLNGIESAIELISNDNNDYHSFIMTTKINDIRVYNTFIYASIIQILGLDNNFVENPFIGNDTYIEGGFVEKNTTHFQNREYGQNQSKIDTEQILAFNKILSILDSKNIPYILVNLPVTSSTYSSYHSIKGFDKIMKQHRTNYFDLNQSVILNDSLHFFDTHHLNNFGVKLVNENILDILSR